MSVDAGSDAADYHQSRQDQFVSFTLVDEVWLLDQQDAEQTDAQLKVVVAGDPEVHDIAVGPTEVVSGDVQSESESQELVKCHVPGCHSEEGQYDERVAEGIDDQTNHNEDVDGTFWKLDSSCQF